MTKLSPGSLSTSKMMDSVLTKKALTEYDKKLVSHEQSLRKALSSLERSVDALESAKEQQLAHQQRPVSQISYSALFCDHDLICVLLFAVTD